MKQPYAKGEKGSAYLNNLGNKWNLRKKRIAISTVV